MRRLFIALLLVASATFAQGYWDRSMSFHIFAGGDSPAVDRAV